MQKKQKTLTATLWIIIALFAPGCKPENPPVIETSKPEASPDLSTVESTVAPAPTTSDNEEVDQTAPDVGSASLARSWGLSEPYLAGPIYTSPLLYNGQIARTQDGTIYTATSFVRDNGVSLVDLSDGTVTPILDLVSDMIVGAPVGGLGNRLLMGVGPEVWEIHPDGSHQVWGPSPDAVPYYYTRDNRLIGASFDGRLVEIKPDGSEIEIASGFGWIGDVLVTDEGIILVYDVPSGDIIRIDSDGTQRVLIPGFLPGDIVNFGMDFDNQVYFNPNGLWDLYQLDLDTGIPTRIQDSFDPCTLSRGDIVFTEPGKLLTVGDQLSWSDLSSGETGILVHDFTFTFAADIGPDGSLYIGAGGCGDQIPAQVLKIEDDGTQSVLIDNLRGVIKAIGFANDNSLYVASQDESGNHIYFYPANNQTAVEIPNAPQGEIASMAVDLENDHLYFTVSGSMAVHEFNQEGFVQTHDFQFPETIHEFRVAIAPDGTLYGLAGFGISNNDFRGPWVLRLNLVDDTQSILAELSHEATGVLSVFTVDNLGNIWVIVNPDSNLFQITPDGEITKFATNLPVDMPAITVDPAGDIYFTVTGGIYRIYQDK